MLLLHRLSHTAARHSVAAAASMGKVYAVKLGRQPGLYQTWDDARKQVDGFSGAVFKSFKSREEAKRWLAELQHVASGAPPEAAAAPEAHRRRDPARPTGAGGRGASSSSIARSSSKRPRQDVEEEEADDGASTSYELAPPGHGIRASSTYRVEYDGGSRGNPGVTGWGAVVREHDTGLVVAVCAGWKALGTNNEAEYSAALQGLQVAEQLGVRRVVLQGDSELVTRQLEGAYKVAAATLRPLHAKVAQGLQRMEQVQLVHVLRRGNRAADQLSNVAMDVADLSLGSRLQPQELQDALAHWRQATGGTAAAAQPQSLVSHPAALAPALPLAERVRRLGGAAGQLQQGLGSQLQGEEGPPLPDHLTLGLAMELISAHDARRKKSLKDDGRSAQLAWARPAGEAVQEGPRGAAAEAQPESPSRDDHDRDAPTGTSSSPRRRGRPPRQQPSLRTSAGASPPQAALHAAAVGAISGQRSPRGRPPKKQQEQHHQQQQEQQD